MRKRNFTYGGRKAAQQKPRTKFQRTIVSLVRAIEFKNANGGYCFPRALTGHEVLDRFGIESEVKVGGLIYRAGPADHDILCFCGIDDNKGHHPGLWHSWVETDADLIDFSCGDWKNTVTINSDNCVNPYNLPPINWVKDPPEFFWRSKESTHAAWRPAPFGPPVGVPMYCPIAEHNEEGLDEATRELMPIIVDAVDRIFMQAGLPVFKIVDPQTFDPKFLFDELKGGKGDA